MSGKIGIYEFNLMPIDLQAETLWANGTFLTNIVDGQIRANLYRLNDFYVEAVFNNPKENAYELRTFKQGDRLDKYLDGIDVNELL